MTLRLFVDLPLAAGASVELPPAAVRHVQVRRLQPGDALLLFDGRGGEWAATVTHIGRSVVRVAVAAHDAVERELPQAVTLAVGMPANERMDWLVEKATELGAAALQPLLCERSVLRLDGERAARKVAHWQGVAVAAAEQSGRTRVPVVAPVCTLVAWLAAMREVPAGQRLLLSAPRATPPRPAPRGGPIGGPIGGPSGEAQPDPLEGLAAEAMPLSAVVLAAAPLCLLSGPEGGFSDGELAAARRAGFTPVGLGPRVLRAETAPLAALAWLALEAGRTPA